MMSWRYIAGFFDGEGNFKIVRSKMKNGNMAHNLQIRIDNCNKELLEIINDFIGYGVIYSRTRKEKNRSPIYQLTICNKKDCKHFLLNVKNLVIEKKDQVDFLLDNFNFTHHNNMFFDIDKFRSFINRKNVKRKYHTIPFTPPTE